MAELFTRQHIGIIMTVIITILLALSTKIIKQSGNALGILQENGKIMRPNETYIDKDLFWMGLEFIALGSILQW